jgi:hypothetical protein
MSHAILKKSILSVLNAGLDAVVAIWMIEGK